MNVVDDVPSVAIVEADGGNEGSDTFVETAGASTAAALTIVEGADQDATLVVSVGGGDSMSDITIELDNPATTGSVTENVTSSSGDVLGALTVTWDGSAAAWSFDPAANTSTDDRFTFTATVTDTDGDVDFDTHEVIVTDGAPPTAGADITLTVDEDELSDGTDGTLNLTDTKTISFTAGADPLTTFVFSVDPLLGTDLLADTNTGGESGGEVTWTLSNNDQTLTGTVGGVTMVTLALTPPTSIAAGQTDTVSVTLTLADNPDNPFANNAELLLDLGDIVVRASELPNDTEFTSAKVSMNVVDDVPEVGPFSALSVTYNPLDPPLQGDPALSDSDTNPLLSLGADGLGVLTLTGPNLGPDFSYVQTGNTLVGTAGGEDIFSLTINPENGTYSFELIAPDAGEDTVQDLAGTPDAGSPTLGLTFGQWFVDAPTDIGLFAGIDNTEVNPSTSGLSGDGNDFKVGEALRFKYTAGSFDPLAGDPDLLNFGLKAPQGATFNVYFYSGTTSVDVVSATGTEASGLVLDVSQVNGSFDTIILEPTESPAALKINSVTTVDLYAPQEETIEFGVSLADADGDIVTETVEVTIDQEIPEAQAASAVTQTFSQSVAIEETDDAILATDGDDVFAFALSDAGAAPADVTISGFGDSGTDSLDLRDLLTGEEASDDLSSYLNVRLEGADTVIEVSSSGSFKGNPSDAGAIDQTITLEGVDLVGDMSDVNLVIQSMLDSGKLTIDS